MDTSTNSTIQGQAEKPIADELAALIYYDRGAKKTGKPEHIIQFEDLEPAEKKPFIQEAVRFVVRLDKMDKMIVKKTNPKTEELKTRRNLDILTEIIRGFVMKLKAVQPALFPCEELAHKILEGPEK